DRKWKKLELCFRATDPAHQSLIYISLLPNQTPRATSILIDDFTLKTAPVEAPRPEDAKQRVENGSFSNLEIGSTPAGAWSYSNMGGSSISGKISGQAQDPHFRMTMNKNTSNYESAQLYQILNLEKGARYEIECRMRWDSYKDGTSTPIVNYGMYHEDSNTWYGPVDQYLLNSKNWETYQFSHIPPFAGKWKLYVQLNGWGNFGNELSVSFDEFSCRTVE
ncbi:MAG: carbohydrate binding domain-containing protein, partial [Luteolibacter sp.]